MIYVRRDPALIPDKVLQVAKRAQDRMELLKTPAERRVFIKKKSHIWRAFGRYLSKMSHGKCWYSESPDPQSFFDVDHFRPKLEAKRSENQTDASGYEWLAFSWENFRYAANCSNRGTKNEDTGVVEGKGSWFPLVPGSVVADWNNRCENDEKPLLIDPICKSDVLLVDVHDDGRIIPSRFAVGTAKTRVVESARHYGLNLRRILDARRRSMRLVEQQVKALTKLLDLPSNDSVPAAFVDGLPVGDMTEILRKMGEPSSPYSRAARSVLLRKGFGDLIVAAEEWSNT